MIVEVRRRLHHAQRVARRANATAFADIGHKVVVASFITPSLGKATREDAIFEVFAESYDGHRAWGWSPWPSNGAMMVRLGGLTPSQTAASSMPVIDSNQVYKWTVMEQ